MNEKTQLTTDADGRWIFRVGGISGILLGVGYLLTFPVTIIIAGGFPPLGAEAFVSRHPWARDVRAVVNLEARGNTGPSQMFETTPGNGAIVRAWAAVSTAAPWTCGVQRKE